MAGLAAAVLAGGTLFGTCEVRLHDAVIDGTKFFLLDLLDPSNYIEAATSGGDTTGT
jgi:hypothetical protein